MSTVPKDTLPTPVQPPAVHPKSPATGKGHVAKLPPQHGIGPSKAEPVTGK